MFRVVVALAEGLRRPRAVALRGLVAAGLVGVTDAVVTEVLRGMPGLRWVWAWGKSDCNPGAARMLRFLTRGGAGVGGPSCPGECVQGAAPQADSCWGAKHKPCFQNSCSTHGMAVGRPALLTMASSSLLCALQVAGPVSLPAPHHTGAAVAQQVPCGRQQCS